MEKRRRNEDTRMDGYKINESVFDIHKRNIKKYFSWIKARQMEIVETKLWHERWETKQERSAIVFYVLSHFNIAGI